jgi:hypothetical protein
VVSAAVGDADGVSIASGSLREHGPSPARCRHAGVWSGHAVADRLTAMRRSSPGQASIEWMGLLALLAVLFVGGAWMAHGVFVGRAITREFARALCRVRDGDCYRDTEPCVVDADASSVNTTVSLFIIKGSHGKATIVEERSDGTVAITEVPDWGGGLDAEGGFGTKIKVKGIDVDVSATLSAGLHARLGNGKTWIAANPAEAKRLLARLKDGKMPPPDITYRDGAHIDESYGLGAEASVGGLSLASLGGSRDRRNMVGLRTDHRTGHKRYSAQTSVDLAGSLSVLGAKVDGAHRSGGELYEIEYDASGRPLDLRISTSGRYGDAGDLPAVVASDGGLIGGEVAGGEDRSYVVAAHLDLTVPANLAAARKLVAALSDQRLRLADPAKATAALRERVEQQGTIEAQIVEDHAGEAGGWAGTATIGLTAGIEHETASSTSRLLAATSRGLDGQWLGRSDCIASS